MESTNPDHPFGTSFKYMKGSVNYRLNLSAIKLNNVSTNDLRTTYMSLLEYHFGKDRPHDDTENQRNIREQTLYLGKNDKLFSEAEIELVIQRMARKKTPGPDGITIEIIQELFMANKKLFTKIMNTFLYKKGTLIHPATFQSVC